MIPDQQLDRGTHVYYYCDECYNLRTFKYNTTNGRMLQVQRANSVEEETANLLVEHIAKKTPVAISTWIY